MRRFISFLLVILTVTVTSCSQNGEGLSQSIEGEGNRTLSLSIEPQDIWVGVPVTLAVVMKAQRGDDVVFPKIEDLPEGLLLGDVVADDNKLTVHFTAQKPGVYTIAPLSVLFEGEEGSVELLSRPIEFEVASLSGEEAELSPLLPAQRIGLLLWWQKLLFALILIVLALVLFWVFYWKKRVNIIPPEPIWVTLERGVSQLKDIPTEDLDSLYDRTTALVKRALDGVYDQHTSERTREEFAPDLMMIPIAAEGKMWLSKFFERSDMVRFARMVIEPEVVMADLDESVRFVNRSIRKAKEPVVPTYEGKEELS